MYIQALEATYQRAGDWRRRRTVVQALEDDLC